MCRYVVLSALVLLTGCESMTLDSMLSSKVRGEAIVFPQIEDPKADSYVRMLAANYRTYLANPQGHFALPAVKKPWPCKVSDTDLRHLSWTRDSSDGPAHQKADKLMAELHNRPVTPMTKIVDRAYYPVNVQCKQGRLEGPQEFFVTYEIRMSLSGYTTIMKQTSRVKVEANRNKPVGTMQIDTVTSSFTSVTPDSPPTISTVPMFAFAVLEASPNKDMAATSAAFSDSAELDGASLSVTVGAKKLRSTMYLYDTGGGAHFALIAKSAQKDGLMHGPSYSYARVFAGMSIPASTDCYENGHILKTISCEVD